MATALDCAAHEADVQLQQVPRKVHDADAPISDGSSDAETKDEHREESSFGSASTDGNIFGDDKEDEEVEEDCSTARSRCCSTMTDDDFDAGRSGMEYNSTYRHGAQQVPVYPNWFAVPQGFGMPGPPGNFDMPTAPPSNFNIPTTPGYFMDVMVPIAVSVPFPSTVALAAPFEAAPAASLQPVGKTSLLLRKLPAGFTRSQLLSLLRTFGLASKVDFMYVPGKLKVKERGSAFVNFSTHAAAEDCLSKFQGFSDWCVAGADVAACEVSWNTDIKGLDAFVERYRNSLLMHESVHDEDKPAVFDKGFRIAFPAPNKDLRAKASRVRKF
jgi:hypothetical protein